MSRFYHYGNTYHHMQIGCILDQSNWMQCLRLWTLKVSPMKSHNSPLEVPAQLVIKMYV